MPAVRPVITEPFAPEGDQAYVYGDVPPVAVTVAVPVFPPLHATLVWDTVAFNSEGCATVALTVAVQPFESVMVTV
ncbi:hypothetical protein ASG01_15455 [Chryseobacterium sp. Leaf180]|nr:hypothetical protein ASG01_15455 [Chryseobacterium sp. Leaf180]